MLFFGKKIFYSIIFTILLAIAFGAGFFYGQNTIVCKVCKPENIDFSLFWEAYNKLLQNFINPEKINNQKIIYGTISGMTKSLDDPHTAFFDPEQAKTFEQDLSGSFNGIGVEVGMKKNQLTIIAPLENTPGQKAGLKAGDLILKINGKETLDMNTDEAVSLIRGPKGTDVVLSIYRDGWAQPKDFKITRDIIKIDSVRWELLEGNIAYIHIFQFGQALGSDFKKIAYEISASPAKKIVLDLRDNPGGYLEVCQDIAGWFLNKNQVVTTEDFGNKEQKTYKANGSAVLAGYPTVVLINQGSASASEILAGAMRDNRGIKLVGEKSFGKGSVQEVVNLSDGSLLKITVAKWLTPKGQSISEVGIEPDVKVEISDKDIENKKDPQLDKALEIVKGLK